MRTGFQAAIFLVLHLVCVNCCVAQARENAQLSVKQFYVLAASCSTDVWPATLYAIAKTESGLQPYAISVNYPEREARRLGHRDMLLELNRQPRDLAEAIRWTEWLLREGFSVSIGLMQVNIENQPRERIGLARLFDPCINLRLGANILLEKYARSYAVEGADFHAVLSALSDYNTGSRVLGLRNGYVSRVLAAVPQGSAHSTH
jgi:type IV secretion system protein VirB1